jgi:hypothetical protein
MGLFNLKAHWMSKARQIALAESISDRCVSPVWDRVQRRANSLGSTEAKGYIRARAGSIINRQATRVIAETGHIVNDSIRLRIIDIATDQVVESTIRQIIENRQSHALRRVA